MSASKDFIGAIDQGTTSTRFIVFDHSGSEVCRAQEEHDQILPRAGWVEHNPVQILERTRSVIRRALDSGGIAPVSLAAIGITNQRETTVVWDPRTGAPLHNAIVWQDMRTDGIVAELEARGVARMVRSKTGLPLSTYFSAPKILWLLRNHPEVANAALHGKALFGTIDTWLIWNLTGAHITDVSNASRTMLMNLETLEWDPELLELFEIPRAMLPAIRPSSDPLPYGMWRDHDSVPICGNVGDQQAALMGQACFQPGEAKNTYGTGNFLLMNTGREPKSSAHGMLTTCAYRLGEHPPVYALEGSVAVTGAAVQWLRDQLQIIRTSAEIEPLANTVEDSGGVHFVPAFSGLFAPHWRTDARGVVVGLSRHSNRGHLARATLESICFQTRDVLEAMNRDSGVPIPALKVDGGATVNNTLMQLQSDILGVPVIRPKMIETTALGAAYAAGLAAGYWQGTDELRSNWQTDRAWEPQWSVDRREGAYHQWHKAVQRSFGWIE